MNQPSPDATVQRLVHALNSADLDLAVSQYTADAVFVPTPGSVVRGRDAVRAALAETVALKPQLSTHRQEIISDGDTALYHSRWSMRGTTPDGQVVEMSGNSSDVLRRQADGSWLIAIDNPHGTAVLSA